MYTANRLLITLALVTKIGLLWPVGGSAAGNRVTCNSALRSENTVKTRVTKKKFAFGEKLGIPYEIFKIRLNLPQTVDEFNFTYSIEFPRLTQVQFNTLMNRFGGQNLVVWQAGRRYSLVDFLPPKIQALVNRTLRQDYVPLAIPRSWRNPMRPSEQEFETGMSCLDAVYEVVRDLHVPFKAGRSEARLFHIGAPIVDAVMKNPRFYDRDANQSLSFAGICPGRRGVVERNTGREVGDVLMIDTFVNNGQGAAHAMLWLDDELYFEKSDMGSTDPFRIVFYEDGLKFWVGEMALSEGYRDMLTGTFYRYKNGLPDPRIFTGRKFDYNWSEEKDRSPSRRRERPLSPALAETYIWNQDVGLGGGLSKFRVNPVLTFQIKVGKDERARLNATENTSGLSRPLADF